MDSTLTANVTLFDRCVAYPPELVQQIVTLAGGAAYLIDPAIVEQNVTRLTRSLQAVYPPSRVAYSYKTNYSRSLIHAARHAGAISEVVSSTELDYARKLGVSDEDILFNGPGKSRDRLKAEIERPITLIADSISEVEWIAQLCRDGVSLNARLGVRVAPRLSFHSGASRFGIDTQDPSQFTRLRRVVEDNQLPIEGIHLHIASDRSLPSYLERIEFLWNEWERLGWGLPEFIDCGGGFASAMPAQVREQLSYSVATLEEYGTSLGRKLKDLCPSESVQFLCEPGTGVLSDAGVFVTPVLDVKVSNGRRIAVVDGTYFSVNPLRSTVDPAVLRIGANGASELACSQEVTSVYGNSCMEIDVLVESLKGEVNAGDILIFAQKGAYAACMATPFIQGIPAVVAIDRDGQLTLDRPRSNADLLMQLH